MKRNWPLAAAATGFFLFILNGILDSSTSSPHELFHGILAMVSFASIVIGLGTAIFRRSFGVVLRVLSALILFFVLGVCFVAYSYGIALRNSALISGKNDLRQASIHYAQHGYVTNYSRHSQVWRSSNVVSIAGAPYECSFTVRSEKFNHEGTLAMTTNGVFIWLDAKHGPKIIDAGYRPPFFPPRF